MYAIQTSCEAREILRTFNHAQQAATRTQRLNRFYRMKKLDKRVRVVRVVPSTQEVNMCYYFSYYSPHALSFPVSGLEWRARENAQMGKYVPWRYFAWWHNSPYVALHFPRPSQVDVGKLVYTPSEEHGLNDKQIRVSVGKYLRKHFDALSDHDVKMWALEWSNAFVPQSLKFAATADEFEYVYTHGPRSCMSYPPDEYSSPFHPVRIYAAGDLQLAYIENSDGVSGRALVWPDKKVHGRIYGDYERMIFALEKAGYHSGNFYGARLTRVEHNKRFVVPYVDDCSGATDDGKFLILAGCNGAIDTQNTCGLSAREVYATCENCSNDIYEEDEVSTDENGDYYCNYCYTNLFFHCENCNGETPRDEENYIHETGALFCSGCYEDHIDSQATEDDSQAPDC